MNGGHLLLVILLAFALWEVWYAHRRLAAAQKQLRHQRTDLAKYRLRVEVLRAERNLEVTRSYREHAVACESCGNDDGVHLVCSDCLQATPDPVGTWRSLEHDEAMQPHLRSV